MYVIFQHGTHNSKHSKERGGRGREETTLRASHFFYSVTMPSVSYMGWVLCDKFVNSSWVFLFFFYDPSIDSSQTNSFGRPSYIQSFANFCLVSLRFSVSCACLCSQLLFYCAAISAPTGMLDGELASRAAEASEVFSALCRLHWCNPLLVYDILIVYP